MLTEEKLKDIIRELMFNKNNAIYPIRFANWCETNGMVTRSSDPMESLNICDNPECESCRELDKAMKEYGNRNT